MFSRGRKPEAMSVKPRRLKRNVKIVCLTQQGVDTTRARSGHPDKFDQAAKVWYVLNCKHAGAKSVVLHSKEGKLS